MPAMPPAGGAWAPPPVVRRPRWITRPELLAGAWLAAGLAVGGIVLGFIWLAWAPGRPVGYVVKPGAIQADETEAFIAGDGRFAVLVLAAGVLGGLAAWRLRAVRGPVIAVALAAGAVVGSLLTEGVGRWLGGGTTSGAADSIIKRLPLSLHLSGLLVVEAAVALLVYGLFTAFAPADDLGAVESGAFGPADANSVGIGDQAQDRGRQGDAARALEQP